MIVDEVTTLTGPGEMIDVVVTERGIAINPRRQDLLDRVKGSPLPIRRIEDIQREVERICGGKPQRPRLRNNPVAVVKMGGRDRVGHRLAGGSWRGMRAASNCSDILHSQTRARDH